MSVLSKEIKQSTRRVSPASLVLLGCGAALSQHFNLQIDDKQRYIEWLGWSGLLY